MRLAVALAMSLLALLQEPDGQPQSLTIDVVASDRQGRTIDSLTIADFSVRDGDTRLGIDSVEYVRTGTPRLFIFFLDEFHVTAGPSADRARQALLEFVRNDFFPGDRLAVVKPLDPLAGIRLTDDRDSVLAAIETFAPRNGDYTPRTAFERNFIAGTPERIASSRTQIVISGLQAAIAELSRQPSVRKTLVFLTEGLPLPSASTSTDARLPGLRGLTEAANRAHVSIYPMSPSVSTNTSRDSAVPAAGADSAAVLREALNTLATDTSGRSAIDAADIGGGLKRALADAGAYYVLTLGDLPPKPESRFRDVVVSVGRPGASLLSRTRIWNAADEKRAPKLSMPEPFSSFSLRLPRRVSPLIRPWFGMSKGEGGATRIDFVWEPSLRVPGDRTPGPVPARVALSVTTLDGVPVFDGTVLPSLGSGAFGPADASRASFQAAAGRLLVRMTIEDAASRVVDRDVRDLVVTGFSGAVSLGSAEILRARNAREWRELASDPVALPVASRDFSRAERLLVRVPVFSIGSNLVVTARLVSGFGAVMRELDVTPVTSRSGVFQIDLPLAGLVVGRYGIDIRAAANGGEARETFDFRVTP